MTAVDTSVCVPALVEWHEHHDTCRRAAREAHVPAHVLLETYSVLTRLPSPHRLDGDVARALLLGRFASDEILAAPVGLQRAVVATLSDVGIEGGATYDGLIALTAKHHGEALLTRDGRARRTYELLDVDHEVISD